MLELSFLSVYTLRHHLREQHLSLNTLQRNNILFLSIRQEVPVTRNNISYLKHFKKLRFGYFGNQNSLRKGKKNHCIFLIMEYFPIFVYKSVKNNL